MSLKNMMEARFPEQNMEEWKQNAEKTLKGKSIESLSSTTYENIKLKPLYSKEDMETYALSQYPGQADFRRGPNPGGYLSEEWKVAQKISALTTEELSEKLHEATEKGQTALAFQPDQLEDLKEIRKAVGDLYKKHPFCVEVNYNQQLIGELAKLEDSEKISGYIASDPLAAAATAKLNDRSIDEAYDQWIDAISLAAEKMPKLKTIMADSAVYHNGGANAVQELAFAVASGVNHLQYFLDKGQNLEDILSKVVFKFSIGSNFFLEIAKLRSARVLWSKVAEAYGASEDSKKIVISAETSFFSKSAYDPYVNMLRAGNEAFAAVLGGVQYLHVSPYNEPEASDSPLGDRIARNTQLILREEAHLLKVSDPAGGSWYVEHLTNELTEKAWALFLEIEKRNGMAEALKSGWVQDQIKQVLEKRKQDIETRKQSIIGTNIYANLDDKPLQVKIKTVQHENGSIQPIPQIRLSESYEGLRRASENLSSKGINPEAGLICLGALKDHKARADFIAGFLAPGAIRAVKSKSVEDSETAAAFIRESNCRHYFICGSNEQYDSMALPIIKQVKEAFPDAKLFLAGLPEENKQPEYTAAGVNGFVHVKSNCYKTLLSLLNEMEVASSGQ
ncbi:methylmalonyl-CoA mutase subunit beta [Bacillus sp. ISL-47]|nr:methylmalonyl-CoA mutase subunit beta [Bacillus sp. ISL-47]MBT2707318.1 methylmalonyl-CoA mutase subunit beta [Pseudomonas sp. ISL-84]